MSEHRDSQSKSLSAKPTEDDTGKTRFRYKLSDLIAESAQVPGGMPLLEDWEAMPSVGREKTE
ncbi:hypothetical protein [Denitromonas sp.]|uniref:hypothetical protein n=1 Tax=Denitromonas sp. TaxID=2734609 RepID=UPI002FDD9496